MKKTMKKSMVVTTIVMVLLLIVALSTATFAWYTSNNQANATATELTSATSSSANIALGWSATANTTSVTFEAGTGLVPMVPVWADSLSDATNPGLPTKDTSAAPSFLSATLQNNGGTYTFKENAGSATPWTQKEGNVSEGGTAATTLYAINYNTAQSVTVEVTAEFATEDEDKDISNMIRVAVVIGGKYIGTLGNGSMSYAKLAGTAWQGKTSSEATTTVACDQKVSFTIDQAADANGEAVTVQLYAWIDGVLLGDSLAGATASFALTFTAA
ncbi:MAG: hypothetical protein K2M36_00855 [Clostridia bacterium]|nr:hypothetical protein [Clostridia bacterium]